MPITAQQIIDSGLSEPKSYRITRDGDRDIRCKGWLIGSGNTRDPERSSTRWTEVDIYLTTGGNLITQRTHHTQWQGESDTYTPAIHSEPADALEWLKEDGGGYLGAASKEAWDEACKDMPGLEEHATQYVD